MALRSTYIRRAQAFAHQAAGAGLRVLVCGAKAYSHLGVFCFDPSDHIPVGRSMLADSVLEALQQATLWQIEAGERRRPKYLM